MSERQSGMEVDFLGFTINIEDGLSYKYYDKSEKLPQVHIYRYPFRSSCMPMSCIVGCVIGRLCGLYAQMYPITDWAPYYTAALETFKLIATQGWPLSNFRTGIRRFTSTKIRQLEQNWRAITTNLETYAKAAVGEQTVTVNHVQTAARQSSPEKPVQSLVTIPKFLNFDGSCALRAVLDIIAIIAMHTKERPKIVDKILKLRADIAHEASVEKRIQLRDAFLKEIPRDALDSSKSADDLLAYVGHCVVGHDANWCPNIVNEYYCTACSTSLLGKVRGTACNANVILKDITDSKSKSARLAPEHLSLTYMPAHRDEPKCQTCSRDTSTMTTRGIRAVTPPTHLIVIVQRIDYENKTILRTKLSGPETMEIRDIKNQRHIYDLIATTSHRGNDEATAGHFYTCARYNGHPEIF